MNEVNEMDVWDEIEGIGQLYIEEELIVGNEPVLFVCVSKDRRKRYLVMTYDSCDGIYVYREIDAKSLLQMLQNKKTMHEIFRDAGSLYVTEICPDTDLLAVKEEPALSFSDEMLPRRGEYFELNSGHIRKYICKLEQELTRRNVAYDACAGDTEAMTVFDLESLENVVITSYNANTCDCSENFISPVLESKVPLSQIAA